jgi:hypothetical protein
MLCLYSLKGTVYIACIVFLVVYAILVHPQCYSPEENETIENNVRRSSMKIKNENSK